MLCAQLYTVIASQHRWGLRKKRGEKRLLDNGGRWGRAHLAWEDFPGKEKRFKTSVSAPHCEMNMLGEGTGPFSSPPPCFPQLLKQIQL